MKISLLCLGLVAVPSTIAYQLDTKSTVLALATFFLSPAPAAAYVAPSLSHRVVHGETKRQPAPAPHYHPQKADDANANSTVASTTCSNSTAAAALANGTASNTKVAADCSGTTEHHKHHHNGTAAAGTTDQHHHNDTAATGTTDHHKHHHNDTAVAGTATTAAADSNGFGIDLSVIKRRSRRTAAHWVLREEP